MISGMIEKVKVSKIDTFGSCSPSAFKFYIIGAHPFALELLINESCFNTIDLAKWIVMGI